MLLNLWLVFLCVPVVLMALCTSLFAQGSYGFLCTFGFGAPQSPKSISSPVDSLFMVVLGTRPEAIKLAPVVLELRARKSRLLLVSTGQHSSMLEEALDCFDLKCDVELNVMRSNQSLTGLTSSLCQKLGAVLDEHKPNVCIVQGDTTTAFVAALECFYRGIPVAHVEAGLRTHNMRSPFPEEFNRQTISSVASWHFAATAWAARNLLSEGRSCQSVFVTGNPVVDALLRVKAKTSVSVTLNKVFRKSQRLGGGRSFVILLTTHRRENQGEPMRNIFAAVSEILRRFENVVVLFPMHRNPNVKRALEMVVPRTVLRSVETGVPLTGAWKHLNRLLLLEPLTYIDNVHAMSFCSLILTDSGGIQEEGVSLGKPVLILRDTTERPEAVECGSAALIGTSFSSIIDKVSELVTNSSVLRRMTKPRHVYGHGNASVSIVDILTANVASTQDMCDASLAGYLPVLNSPHQVVVVLTVWKRATLSRQFECLVAQTALTGKSVLVLVFQNGCHVDISEVLLHWKEILKERSFHIKHIHSSLETGYYGRFLAPLLANADDEAVWILHDDDVLFGKRYYENVFRVVQSGFLATRNCRMVGRNGEEILPVMHKDWFVTWESDMVCDFGGHIWAGKMLWLKQAWAHPPFDLSNCEDFWISAVLKVFYGIGTRSPACPRPSTVNGNWGAELCACADKSALRHQSATVGVTQTRDGLRHALIGRIVKTYNVSLTLYDSPSDFQRLRVREGGYSYYPRETSELFTLGEDFRENCYSWN